MKLVLLIPVSGRSRTSRWSSSGEDRYADTLTIIILNARQRLELVAQVAEAVHHAHQRGLIHRDLKPGNILVDETGQPKVLDFGLARVADSDAQATLHTHVGEIVGTLAYMSPEQVLADPFEIDTRSDVYALGVILYELLADRSPVIAHDAAGFESGFELYTVGS